MVQANGQAILMFQQQTMLFLLVALSLINFVQQEKSQLEKCLTQLIRWFQNHLFRLISLIVLHNEVDGVQDLGKLKMLLKLRYLILMLVMTPVFQKIIQTYKLTPHQIFNNFSLIMALILDQQMDSLVQKQKRLLKLFNKRQVFTLMELLVIKPKLQ